MINSEVLIGLPLNFKNKFKIYPPTVAEVIGSDRFNQYHRMLTITAEDIRDELSKKGSSQAEAPTPFEFLLINCYHYPDFAQVAKEAFYFFLHQPINFFYEQKMIVVGDLEKEVKRIQSVEQLITITEDEYFDFQNMIRQALGENQAKPPEPIDPNEDPRIARIKAKARERDRIKARQGNKNGISLTTSLLAICCMGIGITPLNIGEMSYASLGPIMTMMQDKEKYDVDIRSLLAGADSKKVKPKYWIRNSDKD